MLGVKLMDDIKGERPEPQLQQSEKRMAWKQYWHGWIDQFDVDRQIGRWVDR